ncbi:hydantoinase B/oxoprolinase family protein [Saccharopolyspora karakumensis]|uniref:Hydantoinase B/oxoprolinase family protein n=1 Tax=Saccharopolyspora karakumensis TaxID=2530386 RepID=A0A4V2YVH0_9PSEU|nr:hydantoinase B/oxoprolinase family protein [Saccharopolyspora karakumensis]TDD81437.1 hydantoinase B/oxoprolinase family protein [Saccharopolyspora karakumensis]
MSTTQQARPAKFDPVLNEILANELGSLSEEMAIVISKAGRSPMLKAGEFATALCDRSGRIMAEGFAAPLQLSGFETLCSEVTARYGEDLAPGDVFMSNDPYGGMTHLPDVGVVMPAFSGDIHVGYAVCYSHHSDTGGRVPGGMSEQSRSLYEEGIRLPIVKVHSAGHLNLALIQTIRANVRASSEWVSDLEAKIAGVQRGARGLTGLAEKYGVPQLEALGDGLIEHAERAMRNAVAELADGEYFAEAELHYGGDVEGNDGGTVQLALTLRVAGDSLEFDMTGSSPQVAAGINTPSAMVRAAMCGGLKALVAQEVPANSGFFRPIKVSLPEETIVNPTFPAPVSARAPIFFKILDLVFRTVGPAKKGTVAVPGVGGDAVHLSGKAEDGSEFALLDLMFGGWGARSNGDGIDGVAPVYMGSYGTASIELLENQFPVVIEEFSIVEDSEGAGKYRGAMQISRVSRLLTDAEVMVRSVNVDGSPGMKGGLPGPPPSTKLVKADGTEVSLAKRSHVHLTGRRGDRIVHRTAGAGGYGSPLERDPQMVRADAVEGKISAEHALATYAVVLHGNALDVDEVQTASLRAKRAAAVG